MTGSSVSFPERLHRALASHLAARGLPSSSVAVATLLGESPQSWGAYRHDRRSPAFKKVLDWTNRAEEAGISLAITKKHGDWHVAVEVSDGP